MTPQDVIELAHEAHCATGLFDSLLSSLREHFHCDVAMLHVAAAFPVTGGAPISTLGFDPQRIERVARRWPAFLSELEPLRQRALDGERVLSVTDTFSRAQLRTRTFHRELMAPENGNESLVGFLPWRSTPVASVMLGLRHGQFSRAQRNALQALVPALAIAVVSAPACIDVPIVGAGLTAREREVLAYVEVGMTNGEISRCLGTSEFTVRNQVVSILRKLQLDSRVDLARCGLSRYVVSHRD